MISTQRATGSLFGEMRSRTPSWSTSAAVPGVESRPANAQPRQDVAAARARRRRTCARSPSASTRAGGAAARRPWRRAASAGSPRGPSRGGCPTACRSRSPRTRRPRATRARELLAVVLVGVGRALALAEAAERAADDADVRDVDVAVDDEGDLVAGELGAQLVGGLAQVLDRLGPRLGEQRGQLLGRRATRPSRPFAIAPGTRSRRIARSSRRPRPAPRDERPVRRLDDVEHALRRSSPASMYCG